MLRIKNAKIITPRGVKLVDIIGDKDGIICVGKNRTAKSPKWDEEYDARGRIALPGMIDCHVHLFSVGRMKEMIDLRGVRSIREIQESIAAHLEDSPAVNRWILGRGWDQDLLAERRFPSKDDLDDYTLGRPTMLVRVCGHIAVLNSVAIEEIGGLRSFDHSLAPRQENGEMSGLVKEEALNHCWESIPSPRGVQLERQFKLAQEDALNLGLVAAHVILSENWRNELDTLLELDRNGELELKLSLFLPISALPLVESGQVRKSQLGGRNFVTLGFKLFADGSLGARTAALKEPYNDDPSNSGILNYTTEEITEFSCRVKRLGMILAIHAIGDRAVSQVIEALQAANVEAEDGFRLEHCSVTNASVLNQLKKFIISVQPSFATSDYWIFDRIGRNTKGSTSREAYTFRTFMEHGIRLVAGSDSPVESLDPLSGIRSAMTNPVKKKERLSLLEAIKLYTENAAVISPITEHLGKIAPGFGFNLVILNVKSKNRIAFAKVNHSIIEGDLRKANV